MASSDEIAAREGANNRQEFEDDVGHVEAYTQKPKAGTIPWKLFETAQDSGTDILLVSIHVDKEHLTKAKAERQSLVVAH